MMCAYQETRVSKANTLYGCLQYFNAPDFCELCTAEVPERGQAAGCAIYASRAEQGLCSRRQRRDAKQPHRQCSKRSQHCCRRRGAQPAH